MRLPKLPTDLDEICYRKHEVIEHSAKQFRVSYSPIFRLILRVILVYLRNQMNFFKARRIAWVGYVARTKQTKHAHPNFVLKPETERQSRRTGLKREK